MAKKQPYRQRTDSEKVSANWTKTLTLLNREEYSVAIVRAAVTVELAANLVVRAELVEKRRLPIDFVDHLLLWCNGMRGKFQKLIYPILKDSKKFAALKSLEKDWARINKQRNSVVHSGEFKKKETATELVSLAGKVVEAMVSAYQPDFKLDKSKR